MELQKKQLTATVQVTLGVEPTELSEDQLTNISEESDCNGKDGHIPDASKNLPVKRTFREILHCQ